MSVDVDDNFKDQEESPAPANVAEIDEISEEPVIINDPTIGFSQTDLSVDVDLADDASSATLNSEGTEIDSIPDQGSVLVYEQPDDFEPADSVPSSVPQKPKGVFKRLIGRAVSWLKRFVGF